jgi:hypothetical protein
MATSEKELELQFPREDGNGETMELNNAQEQRVLSKFDRFVMPQMAILVLFAYLDRTNIGNDHRAARLMHQ